MRVIDLFSAVGCHAKGFAMAGLTDHIALCESAIERVKRSADARGSWNPDKLRSIRVDAKSAGEMDRAKSAERKARIEALGDSNPPEMAEVIGRCIMAAS